MQPRVTRAAHDVADEPSQLDTDARGRAAQEDEPPPRDTDAPVPAAREVSDEDADASDNSNHGCLQFSKRARKDIDSKKEQKKKEQKKRKEEHLRQAAVDITDDLPLAARGGKGKGKGKGKSNKGKKK